VQRKVLEQTLADSSQWIPRATAVKKVEYNEICHLARITSRYFTELPVRCCTLLRRQHSVLLPLPSTSYIRSFLCRKLQTS
jgi:hypothetical protein